MEVSFLSGSKLRGWISEVSDSGFVLSHEKRRRLEKSNVAFDQVRAVKQVKSVKSSHTTRNILIGVAIGLVAVAAVFGIAIAAHGGLENAQ